MTVAIDAFKQYQAKRREEVKTVDTYFQSKATIQAGRQLQMVVEHPAWQTYIDHLLAMKEETLARVDRVVKDMKELDSLGEALTKLKLQCLSLEGEMRGLDKPINLVPEMIKKAQEMVKIMDSTKGEE